MRRTLLSILLPAAAAALVLPASAADLEVGPGKAFATPCEAVAAASDGDTILIDAAGTYDGDVCVIRRSGLTLRGVNGRPRIDAAGQNAGGKAIWVIAGDDTTVENVELSGCTVPDGNGAGIRQEGTNLTVRGCYIHHNQDGILTGTDPDSHVLVEDTELYDNGYGTSGYTHNLYIGHVGRFTLRGSWSHGVVHLSDAGHLVKSRAAVNEILYNRLGDEEGNSSRAIDLPNGGTSYVIGNTIQQTASPVNKGVVGYRLEGANPANPGDDLYVVNNTFVNEASGGTLISVAGDVATPAVVVNNLVVGPGTLVDQAAAEQAGNLTTDAPAFVDAAVYDYRLTDGSPAVDQGVDPGDALDGTSLWPAREYVHPASSRPRPMAGPLDVGAHELAAAEPDGGTAEDAGAADAASTEDGGASDAGGGHDLFDGGYGDGAVPVDAGPGAGEAEATGCACGAASGAAPTASLLLLGLALVLRRTRRFPRRPV